MPQRPPASIDMLHSVSRPSIDRAADSAAGEFDGMALCTVGMDMGDDGERNVFGGDARRHLPSTVMRMRFGFFCQSVCVISTCATSEAPIPNAYAPKRAVCRGVAVAANDE